MTLTRVQERCAYESGAFAEGARLPRPGGIALTLRAIELAQLRKGTRVLDIGCGDGETLRVLRGRGFDALGCDIAPNDAVDYVCNAESLPFPDRCFSAVLAECSISVMHDPERVIHECARVLLPDGVLVISDLYARVPEEIVSVRNLRNSCVSGMLVLPELQQWLTHAGFTSVEFEDQSSALRELMARIIFEQGSLDSLWDNGSEPCSAAIMAAMKKVRAGYFLLLAKRDSASCNKAGNYHE